ncbi:armadillo-type protein [Phlyctochytrium arcticum]|nr:armadillo-type protein [Phlyctochytrium arcticum]
MRDAATPVADDGTAVIRIEHKREIREKNIAAFTSRPDLAAISSRLDGSIKKNTAFVRKLRVGLTHENFPSLSKELLSLKLEKYLSEVVAAILEAKLKTSADVWAAVEVCSLLHQRFAEFTPQFLPALRKILGPPPSLQKLSPEQREKEEAVRIPRQRMALRLFAELQLVGIARTSFTGNPKDHVNTSIVAVLKDLLGSDRDNHYNFSIAVTFAKFYGTTFLNMGPSATTSDFGGKKVNDGNLPESAWIPQETQLALQAIMTDYFQSAARRLVREHKHIRKVEKANHEHYIARGEINEDRRERYERDVKAYDKFFSSTQTLAQSLKADMPELPHDETITRMGIHISDSTGPMAHGDRDDKDSIWEDEEARAFYEHLTDLKHHVPAVFLGERKDKAEEADTSQPVVDYNEPDPELDVVDTDDLSVVEDLKTGAESEEDGDKLVDGTEEDAPSGAMDTVEDAPAATTTTPTPAAAVDEEEDEDEEKAKGPITSHAALDTLVNSLSTALSREAIDKLAVEIAFHNSKKMRKKLIRTLLAVPRNRLDMLPYYARLIATLHPYMPEIGTSVVEVLERAFHGHQKRKEQVFIEEKVKNIRFIGELAKFGVAPLHVVFHCIKVLLDDFKFHNVELLCTLLETCGRFLFKTPETHTRVANYLDIMMRKKNVNSLDSRQALMIDNAFYQCNPPDRPATSSKLRTPLELYLRKLVYCDLAKKTVDRVAKQIRKFNWDDPVVYALLLKVFTKIHKVKFSHLHMMAYIVCDLARYYPDFGVAVVDATLEDIRVGLEQNVYKHNQRRIATAKYLGELYNYRLVDSSVIFDTLFLLVSFGHENNLARFRVGVPLDAVHDFFRVRLACTLLETCGQCFDRGSAGKKLDAFLIYLEMYVHTKVPPPMDVDFLIAETFELLRPKWVLAGTYEEAAAAVQRIAMEQQGSLGGGAGGAGGGPDSDDDDEEDEDEETAAAAGRGGRRGGPEDDDDDTGSNKDAYDDHPVVSDLNGDASSNHQQVLGDREDPDDTPVVVRMRHDVLDDEADDAFELQFSRMMQESMVDTRRNDRKSTFDAPVPIRFKTSTPSNNNNHLTTDHQSPQTASSSSSSQQPTTKVVAFTLLTKRGNKHQGKTMALPADSSFVISTRNKQEAEQVEKRQLKQLVLSYEKRERDNREFEGS